MASEIQLAGFMLTSDEWEGLDASTRAELLPADTSDGEDAPQDEADIVW
jgi:hypothetical protein